MRINLGTLWLSDIYRQQIWWYWLGADWKKDPQLCPKADEKMCIRFLHLYGSSMDEDIEFSWRESIDWFKENDKRD